MGFVQNIIVAALSAPSVCKSSPARLYNGHCPVEKSLIPLQASCWEHKCLTAQEALAATQADAQRLHKQAATSAAAVQKQQKLLEQLSAAEAALAASHSSAQKLLQQLGESQASHSCTEQELEGETDSNSDNTSVSKC